MYSHTEIKFIKEYKKNVVTELYGLKYEIKSHYEVGERHSMRSERTARFIREGYAVAI